MTDQTATPTREQVEDLAVGLFTDPTYENPAPHSQSAYVNAICEEGRTDEKNAAIQRLWNESMDGRRKNREAAAMLRALSAALEAAQSEVFRSNAIVSGLRTLLAAERAKVAEYREAVKDHREDCLALTDVSKERDELRARVAALRDAWPEYAA